MLENSVTHLNVSGNKYLRKLVYMLQLKFKTIRFFMREDACAAALSRAFASMQGTRVAAQAKHKSPTPVTRSLMC